MFKLNRVLFLLVFFGALGYTKTSRAEFFGPTTLGGFNMGFQSGFTPFIPPLAIGSHGFYPSPFFGRPIAPFFGGGSLYIRQGLFGRRMRFVRYGWGPFGPYRMAVNVRQGLFGTTVRENFRFF